MKKQILLILASSFFLTAIAQNEKADPILNQRLERYMELNRKLEFDELMNYMHPRLFEIAPRELIVKAIEGVFKNDELEISMDSLSVTGITPAFMHEGVRYKKLDYFMKFGLKFKDSTVWNDEEFIEMMTGNLESEMGGEVNYNRKTNFFILSSSKIMFAIKDNDKSEWLFLGYEEKQPEIVKKLFPDGVIKHFGLMPK